MTGVESQTAQHLGVAEQLKVCILRTDTLEAKAVVVRHSEPRADCVMVLHGRTSPVPKPATQARHSSKRFKRLFSTRRGSRGFKLGVASGVSFEAFTASHLGNRRRPSRPGSDVIEYCRQSASPRNQQDPLTCQTSLKSLESLHWVAFFWAPAQPINR